MASKTDDGSKKTFITFPYPYMNGRLHLGHALTLMKAEAYARWRRNCGDEVLFPIAFHATGMPIVACAEKLRRELAEEVPIEKGTQQQTLLDMGVTMEELPSFVDPKKWPVYFSEQAIGDLKRLGVSCDFTRTFVTTDLNPAYDSFIKWQFKTMADRGFLTQGKRMTVYSPRDGGPCADHDRAVGEGVGVKKFTLLRLPIRDPDLQAKEWIGYELLAATTRPETVFGTTNVWISPTTDYQLRLVDGRASIASEHCFKQLEWQEHSISEVIETIPGQQLLGIWVEVPESRCGVAEKSGWVPVVAPQPNFIDESVGSGVVISVPSNSPTDYLFLMSALEGGRDYTTRLIPKLQKISIVELADITGEYESFSAIRRTDKQKLTIGQWNGRLRQLTDELQHEETTRGVFVIDGQKMSVPEAQGWVREKLGDSAFDYAEPDGRVVSRSGDDCVVALTEQWFIDYGKVREPVRRHLAAMTLSPQEVRGMFEDKLDWLSEWPCSRTVGLGTQLLDTEFLIDSLSDSTIYMAYYTVAHLIEKLPADELGDQLWDAVFFGRDYSGESGELVAEMRAEFVKWYPVDLRVSGLDLVGNHLLMALGAHAMIWPDQPEIWPQRYAINGYAVLNGAKMSKSTGNFKMIADVCPVVAPTKYPEDDRRREVNAAASWRFAIALAGEGLSDANITEQNATVLAKYDLGGFERFRSKPEWVAFFDGGPPPPDADSNDLLIAEKAKQAWWKAVEGYEQLSLRRVMNDGILPLIKLISQVENDKVGSWYSLIRYLGELLITVSEPILGPYLRHRIRSRHGNVDALIPRRPTARVDYRRLLNEWLIRKTVTQIVGTWGEMLQKAPPPISKRNGFSTTVMITDYPTWERLPSKYRHLPVDVDKGALMRDASPSSRRDLGQFLSFYLKMKGEFGMVVDEPTPFADRVDEIRQRVDQQLKRGLWGVNLPAVYVETADPSDPFTQHPLNPRIRIHMKSPDGWESEEEAGKSKKKK